MLVMPAVTSPDSDVRAHTSPSGSYRSSSGNSQPSMFIPTHRSRTGCESTACADSKAAEGFEDLRTVDSGTTNRKHFLAQKPICDQCNANPEENRLAALLRLPISPSVRWPFGHSSLASALLTRGAHQPRPDVPRRFP